MSDPCCRLTFRIESSEDALLRVAAKSKGLTVSQFLRDAIAEFSGIVLKAPPPRVKRVDFREVDDSYRCADHPELPLGKRYTGFDKAQVKALAALNARRELAAKKAREWMAVKRKAAKEARG